jgi:hypothetical protein
MIFWLVLKLEIYKGTKNPIKVDGQNHHTEGKEKGKLKKLGQKMCSPKEPKT